MCVDSRLIMYFHLWRRFFSINVAAEDLIRKVSTQRRIVNLFVWNNLEHLHIPHNFLLLERLQHHVSLQQSQKLLQHVVLIIVLGALVDFFLTLNDAGVDFLFVFEQRFERKLVFLHFLNVVLQFKDAVVQFLLFFVDGLAGGNCGFDTFHVKHFASDPVRDFSEGILKAVECVFTFGFDVLFNMSLSERLLLLITIWIVVYGRLLEFSQCVNHLQIVLIRILVVLLNLFHSFEVSDHRLLNFSQKVLKCMDLILGLINILFLDIFIDGMENLTILL